MTSMTSKVLSLRMDSELFDRLNAHADRCGLSVQDYVVRALVRDDFDERLQASVEETERFYSSAEGAGRLTSRPAPARSGRA
jgi:predicted DNA-binding protein